MPTELADSQVTFLRGKYEAAREVIEGLETSIPETNSIFNSVEDGFNQIEENRRLYETAYDQEPDAEATHELYEEYLGAIGTVASELQVLEIELVYLDLNQYQRTSGPSEYFEHASSLSTELKNAFDIDITTFPVIWDGFAIEPLDKNLPTEGELSQIYVLIFPRTQIKPELYAPILAHEIAHAVFDRQQDLRGEFNTIVRETQQRRRRELDDDAHFARSWRMWFEELFCDACGVLAFGPAYLSALSWYLQDSNPYYIEEIVGEDLHPPAALRFDLVTELADELFPDLNDGVRDDRIAFERHLHALEHARPRIYDTYDYGELRSFIIREVPKAVTHDLDSLIEDIRSSVEPDECPERAHRLATNQYWLESYPP